MTKKLSSSEMFDQSDDLDDYHIQQSDLSLLNSSKQRKFFIGKKRDRMPIEEVKEKH